MKSRWFVPLCLAIWPTAPLLLSAPAIRTIHFPSEDPQHTKLTGYLFEPDSTVPAAPHHPAIVLLHGRAGPYSSLAKGVYDASTLSKRHIQWGTFWASRGYVALLVDSFGPRGYPSGFPRGSYDDRPAEVSEQTVRPLDAYAALRYLRTRRNIDPDRIGVQGWSNGAMTVLVTISDHAPGRPPAPANAGFRAALAEYPGCGMDAVKGHYHAYAPLLIMIASADEEVSPKVCEAFAKRNDIDFIVFRDAEHNFDDPGTKKQSNPANHRATEQAFRRAEAFFAKQLQQR